MTTRSAPSSSARPLTTSDLYEASYVAALGHAVDLIPSPDGDGFYTFRLPADAATAIAAYRQDDLIQAFVRAQRRLRQRLGEAKRAGGRS